jgi:flagella basal body P-ring formation protein FlgA
VILKRSVLTFGLLAIPVLLTAGLEVLLQPIRQDQTAKVSPPEVAVSDKAFVHVDRRLAAEDKALQPNLLTIDKLLPELVSSIRENLQIEGDLRLTPRETWTPFYSQGKQWKVEMVETIPADLAAVSIIQFKVYSGNKLLGVWKQSFHCQLFKDVLVTEKSFEKGRFVDETEFESRTMDVLQMRQRPVLVGDELTRQQLRQSIRPGTTLLWRHISAVPLVRKGDIVDVIASQGGLIINLKGQARENGADGDFILVRNPHSKRDFQAQVINDKKVRVLF